jgi:hypothetical protein
LTSGDGGPATLYSNNNRFRPHCKTLSSDPDSIWAFRGDTNLWRRVPLDEWMIQFLRPELLRWCNEVLAFCRARVEEYFDDEDLEKAWKSALQRMHTARERINTLPPLKNIAAIVVVHLRDDTFLATLNVQRDSLSFRDGMLSLRQAAALEDRTAEHRVSFALSYDWDPLADMHDMITFVRNMFPDPADYDAVHTLCGLWATGEAEKRIELMTAVSCSGKTELVAILQNALESYCLVGTVPTKEILADRSGGGKFGDKIMEALSGALPPRLVVFDEFAADASLNPEVLNPLTGGQPVVRVSYDRKHKKGLQLEVALMAKVVLISNYGFNTRAEDSGLNYRFQLLPFSIEFVPAALWDPATALPHQRPMDPALVARLRTRTPRVKQGIMAWLVEGARRYYAHESLASPNMRRAKQLFLAKSDPYMCFLMERLVPTGHAVDRVPLVDITQAFRESKRNDAAARRGHDGFLAALGSLRTFATRATWVNFGADHDGFTGLRWKDVGEGGLDWVTQVRAAEIVAAQERQAAAAAAAAMAGGGPGPGPGGPGVGPGVGPGPAGPGAGAPGGGD